MSQTTKRGSERHGGSESLVHPQINGSVTGARAIGHSSSPGDATYALATGKGDEFALAPYTCVYTNKAGQTTRAYRHGAGQMNNSSYEYFEAVNGMVTKREPKFKGITLGGEVGRGPISIITSGKCPMRLRSTEHFPVGSYVGYKTPAHVGGVVPSQPFMQTNESGKFVIEHVRVDAPKTCTQTVREWQQFLGSLSARDPRSATGVAGVDALSDPSVLALIPASLVAGALAGGNIRGISEMAAAGQLGNGGSGDGKSLSADLSESESESDPESKSKSSQEAREAAALVGAISEAVSVATVGRARGERFKGRIIAWAQKMPDGLKNHPGHVQMKARLIRLAERSMKEMARERFSRRKNVSQEDDDEQDKKAKERESTWINGILIAEVARVTAQEMWRVLSPVLPRDGSGKVLTQSTQFKALAFAGLVEHVIGGKSRILELLSMEFTRAQVPSNIIGKVLRSSERDGIDRIIDIEIGGFS